MEYYSFRKVLKELDIEEDRLKQLVSEGQIPAVHISRDVRKIKKSLLKALYPKVSAWRCLGIRYAGENSIVSIELCFSEEKRFLLAVEEQRTVGDILAWLQQNTCEEIGKKIFLVHAERTLDPATTLKALLGQEHLSPGTPLRLSVAGLDPEEAAALFKILRGESSAEETQENEDEGYCELSEAMEKLGIEGSQLIELIHPGEIKFFKETLWFKKDDIDHLKKGEKPPSLMAAPASEEVLVVEDDTSEEKSDLANNEGRDTFQRQTTVRYYRQMNPWKNYPLVVAFSSAQLQKIKDQAIAQVTGSALTLEQQHPLVEIIPNFPGCLVTPPNKILDISPASSQAYFELTPLAQGELSRASVEIRYRGRPVDEIATPCRVSPTTWAKISLFASVVFPLLTSLLDAWQLKLPQDLPLIMQTLRRLIKALGGLTACGFIAGGLLLFTALALYWKHRAQAADPVERLLHLENITEETPHE